MPVLLTSRSITQMTSIALLVVDECHHCKKHAPLNQIFKNFYHTVRLSKSLLAHVLGPVGGVISHTQYFMSHATCTMPTLASLEIT